jgi:hypothetical protein
MNEGLDRSDDDARMYARLLALGARLGLVVLILTFVLYMAGLTRPQVPLQQLPALWSLPVDEFLRASGMARGWGWLGQVRHGDVAGLVGIVILLGCSLPALFVLALLYGRRGDRVFVGLCLAQLAVLLLAASGVFSGGP